MAKTCPFLSAEKYQLTIGGPVLHVLQMSCPYETSNIVEFLSLMLTQITRGIKGLVRRLQQDALLGVHLYRLARTDTEESMVELLNIVDEITVPCSFASCYVIWGRLMCFMAVRSAQRQLL